MNAATQDIKAAVKTLGKRGDDQDCQAIIDWLTPANRISILAPRRERPLQHMIYLYIVERVRAKFQPVVSCYTS